VGNQKDEGKRRKEERIKETKRERKHGLLNI
jgi:hypothetical protein